MGVFLNLYLALEAVDRLVRRVALMNKTRALVEKPLVFDFSKIMNN